MRIYDILRTVDPSFPSATAFIADEIAEKIDGDESAGYTAWPPEAYGNIAPPYPAFFVEARSSTSEKEIAEYRAEMPAEWSSIPAYAEAYAEAQRAKLLLKKYDDTKFSVDRALLFEDVTSQPRVRNLEYTEASGWEQPAGTVWVLAVYGFMRVGNADISLFPGHAYLHIGARGQLLDDTDRLHLVEYPTSSQIPGAEYLPTAYLASFIPFGLFAIKALHERCEVELYKPSRQVRRAMQAKEGIAAQSYYILKLTSPSRQKRPEKPAELKPDEAEKASRREHSVRGHFHFYTPEKPLFGRIAGAVWIPAHKRGKKDAGEVKKDYRITERQQNTMPTLQQLADEALAEHRAGRTIPMDDILGKEEP